MPVFAGNVACNASLGDTNVVASFEKRYVETVKLSNPAENMYLSFQSSSNYGYKDLSILVLICFTDAVILKELLQCSL